MDVAEKWERGEMSSSPQLALSLRLSEVWIDVEYFSSEERRLGVNQEHYGIRLQ